VVAAYVEVRAALELAQEAASAPGITWRCLTCRWKKQHDPPHSGFRCSRYNAMTMRQDRLTNLVRRLGLLALVLMACDVARCEADKVRHGTKTRSIEGYVHHSSARRVYAELQKILKERGYTLPDVEGEAAGRTHWTRWKGKVAPYRVSVHITQVKQKQFLVEVREVVKREGEVLDDGRQHDIEWTLIQRLSPKRALEILKRSEERADRTYEGCRGCSSCSRMWLGC
jgi:hypothetical protein